MSFCPSSTHLPSKYKSQDSFMLIRSVSDPEVFKSKNHVGLMNAKTKVKESSLFQKAQVLCGGSTMMIVGERVKKLENIAKVK